MDLPCLVNRQLTESYLDIPEQFLEPHSDGSQWKSEHGCLPAGWGSSPFRSHCPGLPKWYISGTMNWPWVTKVVGSPVSRLNTSSFFVWGFVKSEVYRIKKRDVDHLKRRIRDAVGLFTSDMLGRVFRHSVDRWEMCRDMRGGLVGMQWFSIVYLCSSLLV